MAFNKSNKKIVTTALTAAMVASAVAPVAAAKITPQQDATNKVNAYLKVTLKTSADAKKADVLKKAALDAVKNLKNKSDAKLKTSLTGKINAKSASLSKDLAKIVAVENKAAADKAVKAYQAVKVTTEAEYNASTAKKTAAVNAINKLTDVKLKASYNAAVTKKANELKVAYDKIVSQNDTKNIAAAKDAIAKAKTLLDGIKLGDAITKEQVDAAYNEGMTFINKIKTAAVKTDLTNQAKDLQAKGYALVDAYNATTAVAAFEKFEVKALTDADQAKKLKDDATAAVAKVADKTFAGSLTDRISTQDKKNQAALAALNTLVVTGVSATNNKEIVVTFNKAVDQTTAENAANYTLSNNTLGAVTPVLNADGKSVTLTVTNAAAQQATTDVTIKNVKDTTGAIIADTTKTVAFFDLTAPTVTGVSVSGPNTLKVNFSEPLNNMPNFSVDGGSYSFVTTPSADGKSVTLSFASLPAGNHTIDISGGSDFIGLTILKTTQTVNYAADTSAPTVSISKAAQNSVTLKFSKDIDAATKNNLTVYHTYNNVSGYAGTINWTDSKTAVVSFPTTYLPLGTATVYVNTGTSPNVVKDTWGNSFASTSLTTQITADTTAPTVTSVTGVDSTHIDVTYSKAVTGATNISNYSLKDSSGATVAISSIADQGNNTYRLTTATLNGGSYALAINGIKDTSIAQNALAPYSTTVAIKDVVKPTVNTTGVYSTDKKKIVLGFSEKMATSGVGSVLDKSSYQVSFDGLTYKDLNTISGATITLGVDGKSVIIDFGSTQNFTGTPAVNVGRVADLAGNQTSLFTTNVTLGVDDITYATIDKTTISATSTNKISFTVNSALSAIDVNKFKVNGVNAASATYVNNGNTSVVTVTAPTANKWKADLSDLPANAVVIGANGLTTALGTTNSAAINVLAADVADAVAPAISSVATTDTDTNGKIDHIVVSFSEALYVASVQDTDFTVDGYQVTGVSVDPSGKIVTLSVKEQSTTDTGATPKVTLVGSISDVARNALSNQAAITATDGVAAVATGDFTNADSKVVTINFSEAMDPATLVAANFTSVAGGGTPTLVKAADNKSVTLTFTNALVTGNSVVITGVKDVAGNTTSVTVTK